MSIWIMVGLATFSVSALEELIISTNTNITADAVWTGTVVIDGARITVNQGVTLTLNPGTVVAGKNGGSLFVEGRLKVLGEDDRKVRFTSEYDENYDYSLTYSINSTSTSEIEMTNFILEDGGGNVNSATVPALTIKGKGILTDGVIRRNRVAGVRIWNAGTKISNCEIYENPGPALENKTTAQIKAEDNWWGAKEAPQTSSTPGGNWIVGNFDFDPWQKKGPIPIVIIPGFGASFSFKLLSDRASDLWWLNPVGTHAYRYFVKALVLNRYYHDKDFFWGLYDFRLPCEESARLYLEKTINKAKEESGHSQVNLLAHSLGGLVARAYLEGERYRDDVDRLVTAGTPHLGSGEAYPIWEGGKLSGYKKPITLYLWYLQALNKNWDQLGFIRENFSSVGQMMPIYNYLFQKESGRPISYADQKIKNPFLEKLREDIKLLRRRAIVGLIAGTGEETVEKIGVSDYAGNDGKWEDGIPDPLAIPRDSSKGDDTVTVESALANKEITSETAIIESSHGNLLEKGQKTLFDQLKITIKDPTINKILNHFLLSARGPAEVVITDDQGKVINADSNEIAESQFHREPIEGENIVMADFPLDLNSSGARNVKVNLAGSGEGKVKIALWNLSSGENLNVQEREDPIGQDIKLDYEIELGAGDGSAPLIEVKKVKYSNLLKVIKPVDQEEYLNWQYLFPDAQIWQDGKNIKNPVLTYNLDGEAIGGSVDLARLDIGSHNFEATGNWRQGDVSESESREVNFNVSTSCKSVVTLIDRLYAEEKILSWERRSKLINLIAEAYQAHSNGNDLGSKEKLLTAYEVLDGLNETLIKDALAQERIRESLTYLQDDLR